MAKELKFQGNHSVFVGYNVINSMIVTSDHNRIFVDNYERLWDAYVPPWSVFERVRLDCFISRDRPPSAREMANQELVKKIETVYNDNHGVYGSPRIYRGLKDQGIACSENRIAPLMRLRGLRAKQSKSFKTTTKRNKAHPVAQNLVKRDFTANRPNQKWLSDITYIPTQEGWLYLAAILDLYTRGIVGWAMSDRMTSDLTIAALKMALIQRQPDGDLIYHSD